jgi:hypothetical protein
MYRLTVTEGKYRMVRRVLHNAGHSVLKLHRVRYGQILLENVDEGEVRVVTSSEADWAKGVAKRGAIKGNTSSQNINRANRLAPRSTVDSDP